MGFVESLPYTRGIRPVLALPLWMGTLRDDSGYGNHIASLTAPLHWSQSGAVDGIVSPTDGHLNLSANDSLVGLQEITYFTAANPGPPAPDQFFLYRAGDLAIYAIATHLVLDDGIGRTLASPDLFTSSSIAVTSMPGDPAIGYLDGVSIGNFTATSSVNTTPGPWLLSGMGGATGLRGPTQLVLLYPGVLTPAEISDLHLWSQSRITPRKQWPGGGLDIPTLTGTAREHVFIDNIQTARVTLADQTSGKLSNTPYQIESGTWALNEDATTGERYIECVVAGIISRRNVEAYGTWEFGLYKSGGGSIVRQFIIADNPTASNQTGYQVVFATDEKIYFQVMTAGGSANILISADVLDLATEYRMCVTRSSVGVFTLYIIGGGYTEWTVLPAGVGTNPVTNNTHVSSIHRVADLDAGDRLYLDRQFAGVVSPI